MNEGCIGCMWYYEELENNWHTLGIEALERVKYNSTARFGEYDYSPLPSEGEK